MFELDRRSCLYKFYRVVFTATNYYKKCYKLILFFYHRFPAELRTFVDLFGQNNWHTNLLFPVYQTPGPRTPENNTGAVPGNYFKNICKFLKQTVLEAKKDIAS